MNDRSHLPTALIAADVSRSHETGFRHPECPARYDAVLTKIQRSGLAEKLLHLPPRAATDEELALCHTGDYIALAKREIAAGRSSLSTGDTAICRQSLEAALHAAGGSCAAVDAVCNGQARNAFALHRPPGHHATSEVGMGFCIFNNAAIAARHAQARHNIERVAIIDWDVHHGNGTQEIFYDDPSLFYFSTHQSPWYPHTGARSETGRGAAAGTTMNRPLPAGSGRQEIFAAFTDDLAPALDEFQPGLVIISAGFDAHENDPLGEFRLTEQDFADLTDLVLHMADQHAQGRVVSLLEGGYDLEALARSATIHVERLFER